MSQKTVFGANKQTTNQAQSEENLNETKPSLEDLQRLEKQLVKEGSEDTFILEEVRKQIKKIKENKQNKKLK